MPDQMICEVQGAGGWDQKGSVGGRPRGRKTALAR